MHGAPDAYIIGQTTGILAGIPLLSQVDYLKSAYFELCHSVGKTRTQNHKLFITVKKVEKAQPFLLDNGYHFTGSSASSPYWFTWQ